MSDEKVSEMCIPIHFARPVMVVIMAFRNQFQEPLLDIPMESRLGIINENSGCYMHGRDQNHALFNSALLKCLVYISCNVYKLATFFGIKSHVFSQKFHFKSAPFSIRITAKLILFKNFLHRKRLNLMTLMKVVKGKCNIAYIIKSDILK